MGCYGMLSLIGAATSEPPMPMTMRAGNGGERRETCLYAGNRHQHAGNRHQHAVEGARQSLGCFQVDAEGTRTPATSSELNRQWLYYLIARDIIRSIARERESVTNNSVFIYHISRYKSQGIIALNTCWPGLGIYRVRQ